MRMLARLAGAAVLALATGLAAAVPAHAAPTAALGQCTTTRGTIVAVDFGHWGGPIVRGCGVRSDGQPDSTGYVLLGDGGFSVGGTRGNPAFVCRLGSGSFHSGAPYPTPAEDPCSVTPPSSASWSYWLAPPGATSWRYSDYGATSDHPVAGEVELWTFGGSAAPSSGLIEQLRAHNSTAADSSPAPPMPPVKATPSPPAHHSGATGGQSGPIGAGTNGATSHLPVGGSASHSGPGASASDSQHAGSSASGSAGTSSAAGTSTTGQPSIVAAESAPKARHSSGSALPVVITVVIVAALGGLGGLSLLRRRRSDGD